MIQWHEGIGWCPPNHALPAVSFTPCDDHLASCTGGSDSHSQPPFQVFLTFSGRVHHPFYKCQCVFCFMSFPSKCVVMARPRDRCADPVESHTASKRDICHHAIMERPPAWPVCSPLDNALSLTIITDHVNPPPFSRECTESRDMWGQPNKSSHSWKHFT